MADTIVNTILVVDDNPATMYSTGRFLRAAGFKVREATTGQDALDMANDLPDAILLDVNLPDIDGFEVCRTLRKREKTSRIPIIHLSATFVGALDKVEGLEAGADGYLTQPVEPPVLIATVNAFLRAKSAEENMRRSEQKYRSIFDQAVNGIALLDNRHVFLEVNPAMCRILGLDRTEIIGHAVSKFVPKEYETGKDVINRHLELHGVSSGTLPLLRSDGNLIELDWKISNHSVPGVRLVEVTDMTHRRAAEVERESLLASERAARTEAERANRLKDEFLATVTHELRSPLNAIVGWAHFLKMRKSHDVNDYLSGIDAIDRNARLQTKLISELLDVSSITAGKMRMDSQIVDLAEVIENSLDCELSSAGTKRIAVDKKIEPDVKISGDRAKLQQLVTNLLNNAIKFTPRDGRIVIRLERKSPNAEITVSDNGEGIANAFLPHIFDTFRQEDAAASRGHEGLGLGLAIVKRVVEMHGGNIVAQSEGKGRGSTFIVQLPLWESVQNAEAPVFSDGPVSHASSTSTLRGLRILVVDDDFDTRSLISRVFTEHGAIVTVSPSTVDAFAILGVSNAQVLVSDIGMPGKDGYSLIRQIRAAGYAAERLPAIALTAFSRPEDRSRVLSSGYQAHLLKPIDPEQLVRTVAQLAQGLSSGRAGNSH